ncbi:MAG TPA: ATP-binding protein [bacterium]|mgnify:FL=1|nr:ATP-binding protein [bacterium]
MKQENLPALHGSENALHGFAEQARITLCADAVFLYLSDMEEARTCMLAARSEGAEDLIPVGTIIRISDEIEPVWRENTVLSSQAIPKTFPASFDSDLWTVFRLGLSLIPFGFLFALRRDRPPITTEEIQHTRDLLDKCLPDLHRAWVDWLVKRRSAALRSLVDITTSLASSLDREIVLGKVVQQTAVLLSAKLCSLMLLDSEGKQLVLESAYGCSLEYLEKPPLSVSDSLLGRVVRNGEVIRIPDVRVEPSYVHRELAKREVLCSLLAAPVQFAGEILGVLNVYSATPRHWSEQEEDLLRAVASSAAAAIQNASLLDRIVEIEQKASQATRLSTLGEMTASLAHQIRNPLAVVNMLIHSWESLSLPDPVHADLRVISENINGLNRIVEGALALARGQSPHPVECSLPEIVDGLLLLLRHQIRDKHIQFASEIPEDSAVLFADREQVEQALLNLVVNAVQAVSEGGQVGIRSRRISGGMAVEVWDDGPGIPSEIRATLFEAFVTTKPGGLGLGLPVVHRIVREHGGKITVNDRPGGGTTFVLEFPEGR